MSPPYKVINHEQQTSIVHSLNIDGENFTMTTRAESKIDKEPSEARRTKLEVALSINASTKAWFKESRANGNVESSTSGSSLNTEDLKTFKNLWFHKWQPRIQLDEVYRVSGLPPEKMELTEDYKATLKTMRE